MNQLEAVLLLRSWLQHHGHLPGHDALQPYLAPTVAEARRRYNIVREGGDVAPGHRAEHVYLARFNLLPTDGVVLGARRYTRTNAKSPTMPFINYFRAVFKPGSFYSVEGLRPSLWFFVLQTKVLAGRDQEWAADDAVGKPFVRRLR